MTEDEFTTSVRQTAEAYGYLAYHTHDSRRSTSGFPDLVMIRVRQLAVRVVIAELKLHPETQKRGRPTDDQERWLEAWRAVGEAMAGGPAALLRVYVWRPPDYFSGAIDEALR